MLYLILFIASTAHALTTGGDEDHPFTLYFDSDQAVEIKNSEAQIDFLFQIPEHHYLYSESVAIKIANPHVSFVLEKPAGENKFDEFMQEEKEIYTNQLAAVLRVKFDAGYDYSRPLEGKIYYQGCSAKMCFRLFNTPFSLTVNPDQLTAQTIQKTDIKDQNKSFWEMLHSNDLSAILKQGLFLTLFIVFLAGFLTGFTPCVLPIIPLTLAFIGVAKKQPKLTRASHLAIFVVGLVVMHTTLGVVSAALGMTFGFSYQSRFFLGFLAVLFFVMSLWMFGVLKLNLPSKFQNALANKHFAGVWRYFFAGVTIGFFAAPCVGPVLVPILVTIASSKDFVLGVMLMISYSLGLSGMFVILGFASGAWIARFSTGSNFIKKIIGSMLFLGALFFAFILIKPLLSPQGAEGDGLFYYNLRNAQKLAKDTDKPLLIDFYADWCLPCHELDKFLWSDPLVRETLQNDFVPVKIDCTVQTEQCQDAVEKYNVVGWPTILFINKSGDEMPASRLVGRVLSADEFLEYIKQLKMN